MPVRSRTLAAGCAYEPLPETPVGRFRTKCLRRSSIAARLPGTIAMVKDFAYTASCRFFGKA